MHREDEIVRAITGPLRVDVMRGAKTGHRPGHVQASPGIRHMPRQPRRIADAKGVHLQLVAVVEIRPNEMPPIDFDAYAAVRRKPKRVRPGFGATSVAV